MECLRGFWGVFEGFSRVFEEVLGFYRGFLECF